MFVGDRTTASTSLAVAAAVVGHTEHPDDVATRLVLPSFGGRRRASPDRIGVESSADTAVRRRHSKPDSHYHVQNGYEQDRSDEQQQRRRLEHRPDGLPRLRHNGADHGLGERTSSFRMSKIRSTFADLLQGSSSILSKLAQHR